MRIFIHGTILPDQPADRAVLFAVEALTSGMGPPIILCRDPGGDCRRSIPQKHSCSSAAGRQFIGRVAPSPMSAGMNAKYPDTRRRFGLIQGGLPGFEAA